MHPRALHISRPWTYLHDLKKAMQVNYSDNRI